MTADGYWKAFVGQLRGGGAKNGFVRMLASKLNIVEAVGNTEKDSRLFMALGIERVGRVVDGEIEYKRRKL